MSATTGIHNALVVGAGLAGLSTAISIAKLGVQVTLVERSKELAEGAMITLSNRGPDALAELGVLDECMSAASAEWENTVYHNVYDAEGNRLSAGSLPTREPDGIPVYLFIYRPALSQILTERAESVGVKIQRGCAVTGVVDDEAGVTVSFATGESEVYDLVVAADGSNSKIREHIFPGRVTPHYSGNMSMRWIKRNPPPGLDGSYVNEQSHALFIHSIGEEMVYVAAGVDMENRVVDKTEGLQLFRKALSEFSAPRVRDLLAVVDDGDDVIVRPYTLHNMPAPWNQGRIVVVGDAAHTMSAHLGAGGVMALEDGVVLGQEMAQGGGLDAVLVRFARRRARRTFAAVDACRQMLDLQVNYNASAQDLHRVRDFAFTELLKSY